METAPLELIRTTHGVAITYDHQMMVVDLGIGLPFQRDGEPQRWWWSLDGSLQLVSSTADTGQDVRGEYDVLRLTYADHGSAPLVHQVLKHYRTDTILLVETTALRDLQGTSLSDSFVDTTFNSPVVRLAPGLRYLTYTWGLRGHEGTGIGGHFPDAVVAPDLASLPEQLRRADFSPTSDVHDTTEKPFAPLIAYDSQERTLVMAPLDHFLISPLRLIHTPAGVGVARGLHGAVDVIPSGTVTRTALVFGRGMVQTMLQWGDLLLAQYGKRRSQGRDSPLVRSLGFWNCYGSYYAALFRPTTAQTLLDLAAYYRDADIPVQYVGLDLWYSFAQVGFARTYRPDPEKYPQGLKTVHEQTGLPFLLHMSAFDSANAYVDSYAFVVDEGAAYPASPTFYQDRAREFRAWGARGIWPDFLRTQLQNARSLRNRPGAADQWFDGLVRAMAEQELEVLLCMPTVGHYLASTRYANVIAVRTSTDYVNHQQGQLTLLRHLDEYRTVNTPQRNLRQNLLVSLLAAAVGLAPSYDVFITNRDHPEGFAEPDAPRQALARALSAGIAGIGDKLGHVDKAIVARLTFPDGTLSQPDHPLYPVVATLPSGAPAFYTTTSLGPYRWTYVAVFNLTEDRQEYQVDLGPFLADGDCSVYDYQTGQLIPAAQRQSGLSGQLAPGQYGYWIIAPRIGPLYLLGFLERYVSISGRQVQRVATAPEGTILDLHVPRGRRYTLTVAVAHRPSARGRGLQVRAVEQQAGLTHIAFQVETAHCRLVVV